MVPGTHRRRSLKLTMSHLNPSAAPKLGVLLVAAVLGVAASVAHAEEYPSKPVTIVVPYPPGSTIDSVARLFQPILSESIKQPVIVENRGGASTNIGTEYVARSRPDGYTVLFQVPNIATNEFMFKTLRWKRDDFAPVALLARWSNVLMAGPSAKVRDFKELLADKDTASMNYGTPGVGLNRPGF